ncbi:uncharacterized protein LOC129059811 [Pongo abelii]|uniref:uncharacterized protein LOC129059811 n=1 Tax=Pongo abelii TaxID=9601 RepID=UPI00300686FD
METDPRAVANAGKVIRRFPSGSIDAFTILNNKTMSFDRRLHLSLSHVLKLLSYEALLAIWSGSRLGGEETAARIPPPSTRSRRLQPPRPRCHQTKRRTRWRAPVIPAPREAEVGGSWVLGGSGLRRCVERASAPGLAPTWDSRGSPGVPGCLRRGGPGPGRTRSRSNSPCWAAVGPRLRATLAVPPGTSDETRSLLTSNFGISLKKSTALFLHTEDHVLDLCGCETMNLGCHPRQRGCFKIPKSKGGLLHKGRIVYRFGAEWKERV